ncbi:hypothetical protein FQ187_03590 [Pseudomonas sp. ANT_J28]|nr:hypothetical protein FQ187_03590 [Pseudomonas sp. ANT_J28]
MRVKLQNFAKAAILAIAQQNCSIDDVCPARRWASKVLGASATRAMVFLLPIFKCPIVSICDDCITLFNYTGNLCPIHRN